MCEWVIEWRGKYIYVYIYIYRHEGRIGGYTHRLCPHNSLPAGIRAHPRQRSKHVIGEYIDASVVGLEVVDLLLEHQGPEILAQELDHIEGIVEAWPVSREATGSHTQVSCQQTVCLGRPKRAKKDIVTYRSTSPSPTRYPSVSSL